MATFATSGCPWGTLAKLMRVFVTGAAGFVGSHLVRRLLRENCEVTALVRPQTNLRRLADVRNDINIIEGSVLDVRQLEADLRARRPQLCFHLAWYIAPGVHPNALQNLDFVTGSMDLLRLLDAVGCGRTIITGTCLEQDASVGYLTEATRCVPQNFYASCKHALHVLAEAFSRRQQRGFAWARLFNTYGPWEYEGPLIPDLIASLLANRPCSLTEGTQIRDFLHVEDTAAALWAIASSQKDGDFNVGSGQPVTVAEVARKIGALLQRPDLLRFGARPSTPFDNPVCCADPQRLLSQTTWRPSISLASGLEQTVNWWKTNAVSRIES